MKIGFIGIGNMGLPMASNLARSGYEVTVYNRTPEKANAWISEYGGTQATTPAAAAKGAKK